MDTQRKDTKNIGSSLNNIFNFCDCNILAKVRKPHSLLAIYFLKCDDPYLIDEVTCMLNTGDVTYSSRVMNPDLPDRVHSYTAKGYNVEFFDSQINLKLNA